MDYSVVHLLLSQYMVYSFTEKVTKHCDKLGNWVETVSTCQPDSKDKLEVFGH